MHALRHRIASRAPFSLEAGSANISVRQVWKMKTEDRQSSYGACTSNSMNMLQHSCAQIPIRIQAAGMGTCWGLVLMMIAPVDQFLDSDMLIFRHLYMCPQCGSNPEQFTTFTPQRWTDCACWMCLYSAGCICTALDVSVQRCSVDVSCSTTTATQ